MMDIKRGFQKKTINQNIENKITNWLESISDESFREEILNSIVITGGSIASMLLGELPNDYDVYFKNNDIAKRVAEYYVNLFLEKRSINDLMNVSVDSDLYGVKIHVKSAGVLHENVEHSEYEYFESSTVDVLEQYMKGFDETFEDGEKYRPVYISDNAITLTDGIQIVVRFTGSPERIHTYYDFVHCTNYWTKETGVVLNLAACEAVMSRTLSYIGSKFPICSMFRIRKFIQRGWSINAGEILKIAYDINNLDLHNIQVLQEQLVGMDAAYFHEVLIILNQSQKEGREIDRTYLFEIINRVFNE